MQLSHHARALGMALAVPAVIALGSPQALAQEEEQQQDWQEQEQQEQVTDQQEQGQTLLEVAQQREDLSMFVQAVQVAGLEQELRESGPYTVFAPSNEAFENHFSQEELDQLFGTQQGMQGRTTTEQAGQEQAGGQEDLPEERRTETREHEAGMQQAGTHDKLLRVLRAHIVPGQLTIQDLQRRQNVQNVLGNELAVNAGEGQEQMAGVTEEEQRTEREQRTEEQETEGMEPAGQQFGAEQVQIAGVAVVEADIEASNGVIHQIDGVIEPEQKTDAEKDREQKDEGYEPPQEQDEEGYEPPANR